MYKWLEYELNTSVKNNFGINLASKQKLIVGLVSHIRNDIN